MQEQHKAVLTEIVVRSDRIREISSDTQDTMARIMIPRYTAIHAEPNNEAL